jgi:hypothetical protein
MFKDYEKLSTEWCGKNLHEIYFYENDSKFTLYSNTNNFPNTFDSESCSSKEEAYKKIWKVVKHQKWGWEKVNFD